MLLYAKPITGWKHSLLGAHHHKDAQCVCIRNFHNHRPQRKKEISSLSRGGNQGWVPKVPHPVDHLWISKESSLNGEKKPGKMMLPFAP